jgi:hypothetical protein
MVFTREIVLPFSTFAIPLQFTHRLNPALGNRREAGLKNAVELVGQETVDRLTITHPRMLLS